MTIVAAFVVSPLVLMLGFFIGSMFGSQQVADLRARCEWLTQMLWEQGDVVEYDDLDDEDVLRMFQRQIDDLDDEV